MSDGRLQAVFFDLDGLLVDSEPVWLEVESEVMAWLGGEWSSAHHEHLVGGSLASGVAYMVELAGSSVALEEVEQRVLEGMAERLSTCVPLMPGAKDLLTELRAKGVTTALVSSSYRRLIEPVLDAIGREYFQLSVAGDEVTHTKPAPEPYLLAAARLGAEPGRCVVLEDSPNGVAAAEAAGCVTVAVPGLLPISPAPGRIVVSSLREVTLEWLSSLVV